MGAGHGEKYPRDPRQQLSTLLQGLKSVGKVRRLRVVDYRADLRTLLLDALIKCRAIVVFLNEIKRRGLVRQQTDAKKGVCSDIFLSCTGLSCKIRLLLTGSQ